LVESVSANHFVEQLQEFFKCLLTRREFGLPAYSGAVNFFAELQHLKRSL